MIQKKTPTGQLAVPATLPPPDVILSPAQSGADRQQGRAALLMCLVAFIFALQDGVSRHLGTAYSPAFVVMLRYWFFVVFALVLVMRSPGGLRAALRTKRPWTQVFRGVILVVEIIVTVEGFVRLGLINTHAIFACSPLIVVALSGPLLGEKIGWRRWTAVGAGFAGILIILNPSGGMFVMDSLFPFAGAVMFAAYLVATRHVSRDDPSMVSFFWTAFWGAIAATIIGWRDLQPVANSDIPWLVLICCTAALSHYLLIRCYEMAEASSLQPFSYTQLVWVSFVGVIVFSEVLTPNVVIGAIIVVGAGLFTWWRERQRRRQPQP